MTKRSRIILHGKQGANQELRDVMMRILAIGLPIYLFAGE